MPSDISRRSAEAGSAKLDVRRLRRLGLEAVPRQAVRSCLDAVRGSNVMHTPVEHALAAADTAACNRQQQQQTQRLATGRSGR